MKKPVVPTPSTEETKAEERRQILTKLLEDRGMTAADLARAAGFVSPNRIYNFMHGRTKQFTAETLDELSKALKVPVRTLMGLESAEPAKPERSEGLIVRASCAVGEWRDSFDLPLEEQFRARMYVSPELRALGTFGVLVRGRGAEKIYPRDTVLAVVPLDSWDGTLVPGRRVILQRIRDRVEVTVREIEVRDGHAWLWPRSNDPSDTDAIVPVEMPWPVATHTWKKGEDRFRIAGVVVEALIPEG